MAVLLTLLVQFSLIKPTNPCLMCVHFSPLNLFCVLCFGGDMCGRDFQLGPAAVKMSFLTNWGIRLYASLPENQDSSCNTNHPSLCGTGWKGSSELKLLSLLTKKLFEQIRLLLYVINKYGFWLNHMDFPPWRTETDTEATPGKKRRDSQRLLIARIAVWFPNGSYFRAFPVLNIQRIFKKAWDHLGVFG